MLDLYGSWFTDQVPKKSPPSVVTDYAREIRSETERTKIPSFSPKETQALR